jgi:hypothetical protein
MLDLFVLTADKNMLHAVRGVLNRPQALGISSIRSKILPHPNRDGGVRTTGKDLLAWQVSEARHGLLLLDHEGSGSDESPAALEARLDEQLRPVWGSRAKAIVIEPELDIWVWGADNALRDVFEWNENVGIREWLVKKGFEFDATRKPLRPKEALEALMFHLRRPRSSSLYEELATKLSLHRCTDSSFDRLRSTLSGWFPR